MAGILKSYEGQLKHICVITNKKDNTLIYKKTYSYFQGFYNQLEWCWLNVSLLKRGKSRSKTAIFRTIKVEVQRPIEIRKSYCVKTQLYFRLAIKQRATPKTFHRSLKIPPSDFLPPLGDQKQSFGGSSQQKPERDAS